MQFVFYWNGKQRFENHPYPPTPQNVRNAENLAKRLAQDLERDTFCYADYFPDSPNATGINISRPGNFAKLWEVWLAQKEVGPASVKKYRAAMRKYWLPLWADRDYRSIHFTEIQGAITSIAWGTTKTRNDCLTPLRGMFKLARVAGWLQADPMEQIEHKRAQKPLPDPLEPAEAISVIEGVLQLRGENWRNYFGTMFFTGMRPSEAFGLRVSDVSLTQGVLRVEKAYTEQGWRDLTKTLEARDVEINQQARQFLEPALQAANDARRQNLFAHDDGRQIKTGKTAREIWNAVLKILGIHHRTAYNTRHTSITMQIMAGANIFWIAKQHGTSVRVIEQNYARWIRQAAKDRENSKLGAYLADIGL